MMSKYNESMRYAYSGIKLAQELEDREAKARLFFCIGENNWRLSFKDKAYDYLTVLLNYCAVQIKCGR